jgi:hypothetical protein
MVEKNICKLPVFVFVIAFAFEANHIKQVFGN